MENFSVKAILSAVDKGFTSTIKSAASAVDSMSSIVSSGIGFGILTGVGQKAFDAISDGVQGLIGDMDDASKAWQTFDGNMSMNGHTKKEIAGTRKELQRFAEQTIYSSSDMASTFAQLDAVGVKNCTNLVKGFGGLAAAAENPQQAMKTLSQQATQMAAKPKVAWQDFKLMVEQTPAGIAAVAKQMGMSTQEMISAVQEGNIATEDFFDAITKVGTNDAFTKLATEYKTAGQAMDGLKETISNKLLPVYQNVSDIAIKKIEQTTDALGGLIDKLIAAYGNGGVGGVLKEVGSLLQGTNDSVKGIASVIATLGAATAASTFFQSGTWSAISSGVSAVSSGFAGMGRSATGAMRSAGESIKGLSIDSVGKGIQKSIRGSRKAFKSFGQGIDNYGFYVAESMSTLSSRLEGTGIGIWQGFSNVGGKISSVGNGIGKSLSKSAKKATSTLGAMSSKVATIAKPFTVIGAAAGKAIATVGSAAVSIGAKTVSGLTQIMGLALKALMPAALVAAALAGLGLIYTQFGSDIDKMLNIAQTEGPQIITNLVNGISGRLPELIKQGGHLVSSLMDTVTANLPAVINGGVTLVQSLVSGLISALPELIPSAVNMVSTLITGIASALPNLIVTGMQLLLALAQGIAQNLPALVNSAITAISTFAQGFIQNLPTILATAAQIIGTLAYGIIGAIPQLIEAIPQVVSAMIDTIMETDWLAVGKQIVTAIGDGIFGGLSNIGGKIGDFFGGISDWFAGGEKGGESVTSGSVSSINAGIPQVASASAEMGAAATDGVASGMASGVDAVSSAAQNVVNSATDSFSSVSGDVKNVAASAMDEFGAAINAGGTRAVSNSQKIGKDIVTAFKPAIAGARTSGQTIGQNLATGINSKRSNVSSASKALVNAASSAMSNVSTYQYGVYIGAGLANGIWSQLGAVRAAANALVAEAERAIRAKAQIHSPSKLTDKLGQYFGKGFVNGVEAMTNDAWNAAQSLISVPDLPKMSLAGFDGTLNDEYFYNSSAEYVIYVPVEIDGREVAKVTAPYTEAELRKRQKHEDRKKGIK